MPHRPAREPRRQQIASRPILFDGGINLLDPAQVHANQHVAGRNWFRGEDMVIRPRPGNLPWEGVSPLPPSGPPPTGFSPDAVLSTYSGGTKWTTDSGATWTPSTGLDAAGNSDLWSEPNAVVWATRAAGGATNKVLKSTDNGKTFALIGNPVHAIRGATSVTVIRSTGRIVVGLSNTVAPNDNPAIAYSDDQGVTWTTVIVDATIPQPGAIRPYSLRSVTGTILVLIIQTPAAGSYQLLYRSTNGGASWATVGPFSNTGAPDQFMDFIWKDPNTGFLFSPRTRHNAPEHILWRSTDNGATWQDVNNEAAQTGGRLVEMRSQIARWDGKLLFLHMGFGSARQSSDNGATWTAYTGSSTNIGGVYRMEGALIAARDQGPANDSWRSVDGTTWVAMLNTRTGFASFASPVTGEV